MEHFAVLSNYLILPDHLSPVPGIIEIQGEFISKITLLNSLSAPLIKELKNSHKVLIDLSEFTISPGLVELNSRVEHESFEEFSKSAISGGVTFALVEESLYSGCYPKDLTSYCDIGLMKTLDDSLLNSNFDQFLALKAYLSDPILNGKVLKNLNLAHDQLKTFPGPLLIDPCLAEKRMLWLSSPNRVQSSDSLFSRVNIWADAYGEDEDSESSSEEVPKRTSSYYEQAPLILQEDIIISNNTHSKGGDEIISYNTHSKEGHEVISLLSPHRTSNHHPNYLFITHSSTLFDDIDQKITTNSQRKNSLHLAETNSYQYNKSSQTSTSVSPEPLSPLRPLAINTRNIKADDSTCYNNYLANCAENWEVKGLELLFRNIQSYSRVHVQGISSALAFNLIRRFSCKNVTCEVPASHLYFTSEDISDSDTRFKAHPPIRDRPNRDLLWELVKLGCIQVVSSGHSKVKKESSSFRNANPGISTIGNTAQVLWTARNKEVNRVFKWTSTAAAKVLGLKRGAIEVGRFADLVVWKKNEVTGSGIFEGQKMDWEVFKVYLRGKIAFENGTGFKVGQVRMRNDEM